MEDGFRIPFICSQPAEQRGRCFVAPRHTLLEVHGETGLADLRWRYGERLHDGLERDSVGLPLHRTESGDDTEQGRRDGGREPPEASSSRASYNSVLVVVMHMSPRVESKSLTNNRETGHSS